MISAFATVVTLLGAYVLKPSIVIDSYSSTDPTKPFAQQFVVQTPVFMPSITLSHCVGFPKTAILI
jgi:hypothetical protein